MRRLLCILAALFVLGWGARPAAHDIPADVVVQAYLKPDGQRLRLILRVPLATLRDIQFPTRGPGFLQLFRADPFLRDGTKMWLADSVALYEGGRRLDPPSIVAVQVSLPWDRSFASYDEAVAHITGPPLPPETELVWNQGLLDVILEYAIASDRSEFSIRPEFARLGLRVATVLRFLPPGGALRAFEYLGDPGLIRLDPRWHHAALQFTRLGFGHILEGIDHLLFLFCLVIPFRRIGQLVLIVTSFTVAHSVTLIASAFGAAPDALWFPPLIETLIAMSIVYMALENIIGATNIQRRWVITFLFGLVHGFGFSFALRETLQFAGSHLLTSLLAFNAGVELGQLLVLAILIPLLHAAFRFVMAERIGTVVLSALVAHTAWHWMIERGDVLMRFDWTAPGAPTLARALRWLMAAVIVAGVAWLARDVVQKRRESRRSDLRSKFEV
jgi:hypothetical protein